MITLSRRKLLGGLGLLIAAPAIVKASSLMPVKAYAATGYVTEFEGAHTIIPITSVYPKALWPGVKRWWTEAYTEESKYMLAFAAEPLCAGQPVVLR